MTERESLGLWSTTAASNATADPNIGWAEGQLPSTVNNSARAMMAATARFKKDIDGSLTTAGSANAYTLTINNTWTAYANGQIISFKANFANTGAATINVTNADTTALGAKAIRAPGDIALLSNQMISGGRYFLQYDTAANSAAGAWILLNPTPNIREALTASRAYYVGASATVSVTIASPGVVTWTGHGLSANASVVLSFLPFRLAVTMTLASPGVVTWTAHGFSAGQPIVFSTTGALPTGVTAGTTYFVIATGLTTNTFQFSATVGGSAVNTSVSQSGTHFGSKTGTLPTGLSVNTQYFVKTVLDANTFTLSTTQGGAVINTTGSQSGTITGVTGSDSNTGLAQTTTGAFLTAQKAFDTILKTIDRAGFTATVQLADGTTLGNISMVGPGTGGGTIVLQGNVTYPDNAFLLCGTASTDVLSMLYGAQLTVGGVKFQATSTGNCMAATYGCDLSYSLCTFGTCALHVHPDFGSRIIQSGVNTLVGAANAWIHNTNFSYFQAVGGTLYVTGALNFPTFFFGCSENTVSVFNSLTFVATAVTTTSGSRYYIHQGATVETASATFDPETYFPGSTVGIFNGKGTYNDFFARIDMGAIAAPATPGSGTSFVYTDSTTKALCNKDDAGVVHTTVRVGSSLFAWVFFSVSGGVCTILSSLNVSSVSYSAAGQYVVHFTTSATSANSYGGTVTVQNGAANAYANEDAGRAAGTFPIVVVARATGATTDVTGVNCMFFGS